MDSELAKIMFDQMIEKYHKALHAYIQGNAAPILEIFSEQEDVSLADPTAPVIIGRQRVVGSAEKWAARYHEGSAAGFDGLVKVVTPNLAYIVEKEHYTARIGDKQAVVPMNPQVTSIFRLEASGWRLLHRHADPIAAEPALQALGGK